MKLLSESITQITNWASESVFIYPLLLSFISAIVFWFFFSQLPFIIKAKKMRPIVELGLVKINNQLFHFFEVVMRHSDHSPSFFQSSIRSGKLSRENIRLGLCNKCKNDTFLYDSNVNKELIIVGGPILEIFKTIEETIDRIIEMKEYVKEEEILLVENIRQEMKVYDSSIQEVNRSAEIKIGNQLCYPALPAIIYKTDNYYILYKLYCNLMKTIYYKIQYSDRDLCLSKLQYLYENGSYRRCKRVARKCRRKYVDDKSFITPYVIKCDLKLKNKKYYKLLEKYLESKPYEESLEASRDLLKQFVANEKAIELIKKYHSDGEFNRLKDVIRQEEELLASFIKRNKSLEEYYLSKDPRLRLL